jgi:hypothetical protein
VAKSAQDRCKGCRRSVPDAVFVTRDDEPFPTAFVYVNMGRGSFAFCNLCFEAEKFDGLSSEEIVAVSELFASLERDG